MLASALRGNVAHRAFENLEQRLLHAFAGHIARDGNVVRLAPDLVDFVDVDDAALRPLHVEVRRLQQPQHDILHVFADIARLGERRRIGNRKGHVEHLGERAREQRLAGAGRTGEQDVALFDLHFVELGRECTVVR